MQENPNEMQHLSSRAAASFLGSVAVPAVSPPPLKEVIVYTYFQWWENAFKGIGFC